MDVVIEPLADGDWQRLRDLRLQALRDAPEAFWATWEDESRFGAAEWTRFAGSVAWFVAAQDGRAIGVVGAVQRADRADRAEEREVIGMWVHPAARRRGIAGRLLEAMSTWSSAQGAAALTLWVTHGNEEARTFYQRRGFTLTGEEAPMPGGRTGTEVRMRRALDDVAPARARQDAPSPSPLDRVPHHLADLAAAALERAEHDPRVVGLVLRGSVARGTADEFSDLDLVIVCDDDTSPQVRSAGRDFAAGLGPLLVAFTGEHVGEPRLLIALYDSGPDGSGPRHVDLTFVSARDLESRVEDGIVVWQRDGVVDRAYARRRAAWPFVDPQWIEDRFWVWVHYTTVKVARGELYEAVDALTFMRATALAPLIVADKVPNPTGVRRIERIDPATAPALRATLADVTVPDCLRAAEATVDLYLRLRDLTRTEPCRAAERAARDHLRATRARIGTPPPTSTGVSHSGSPRPPRC